MQLTLLEKMALVGLQARDREVFREYVQPLQDEFKTLVTAIEERLDLPPGSIGTTHQLDQQGATVTPLVPPEPDTPAA